jgi:CheY-like chemotaxis protein
LLTAQILINLLTNAIKFTRLEKTRSITVSLAASETEPLSKPSGVHFIDTKLVGEDHHLQHDWKRGTIKYIQFSVIDTGRGLSQEEMTSLFTRFSQASPRTHIHYGGSGLGLFISRRLTELQGGSIGLVSESKRGSTFSFFIKTRQSIAPPGRKDSIPSVLPEDMRHRSEKPTLKTKRRPSIPSPIIQIDESHAWHSDQPPKDLNINTQRRKSLHTSVPTELFDLAPPLDFAELKRTKSIPETLHVLVVEDNLVNQKVLAKQLRNMGCVVSVANHGHEALDFLPKTIHWDHDEHHSRQMSPGYMPSMDIALRPPHDINAPIELSLILMDWEMPICDGLTAVARIRTLEKDGFLSARIPVIGVTANVRQQQIQTAIAAGMDDVVGKPFRVAELFDRMKGIVAGVKAY